MKKTIYPIMFLSLALISGCNKNPSSSVEDKDSYLVSYYSEDNSLLYQDQVKKGASSLYKGDEPTKKSQYGNYEYSFFGWDKELTSINSDLEVHPIFKKLSTEEIEVGDYTYRRFITENNETEAYEIYKYNNFENEIDLVIPSNYLNKPVIQIGKACFMETPIKSITIPEGIEIIDAYAFNSCNVLSSVTLPSSLRIINHAAFYLTINLKELDLKNTQFIGEDNFELCESLRNLSINTENNFYSTYEGGLYTFDYSKLIKMSENVSKVNLHEKCNTLGIESLSRLNNVLEVTIPSSITNMEEGVFFEAQFSKVNLNANIEKIPFNTFKFCRKLKEVTLPSSLTMIGDYGFYRCENLTSITFPDSLTEIGEFSFAYCFALKQFNISSNLEFIGYGALDEMTELEEFVVSPRNTQYRVIEGSLYNYDSTTLIRVPQTKKAIMIPNFVTTIGSGAFYKCQEITQLQLPNKLETIEQHAFYFMNQVTKLNIPSSVTTIEASAFDTMEQLSSITIPDSITVLAANLFAYCTNLSEVNLPKNLETIGKETFYSCESIIDITFPVSLKEVGYHAFELCSNLESIHYNGTEAQFNKINLRDSGIPSPVTVYCNED